MRGGGGSEINSCRVNTTLVGARTCWNEDCYSALISKIDLPSSEKGLQFHLRCRQLLVNPECYINNGIIYTRNIISTGIY